MYIEEIGQLDEEREAVFKLSNLAQLYALSLEQLGVKLDVKVHTTQLKQCLLTHFIDMQTQKKGKEVLLGFEEDNGTALPKPVSWTVTIIQFTLHVLQRLFVTIIC